MTSVHATLPLDYGGPIARSGFNYQDHIAVRFCVEMLTGEGSEGVWCELIDDITLIWPGAQIDEVEVVQVKSERRNQMWNITALISRSDSRVGTSILEKSLANDQWEEPCRFRIVTLADIAAELRCLATPLDSVERATPADEFSDLCLRLTSSLSGVASKNGNSAADWAVKAYWDVQGDITAVAARTRHTLTTYLYDAYNIAAPDQIAAIYDFILGKVFKAGLADARASLAAKKISQSDLSASVLEKVRDLRHPSLALGSSRLRYELANIGFPEHEIDSTLEEFFRYATRHRSGRYLALTNQQGLDSRIAARLRRLSLQRASGELTATPLHFHNLCVESAHMLAADVAAESPHPAWELEAYFVHRVYDLVNRGLHTFLDAQVQS